MCPCLRLKVQVPDFSSFSLKDYQPCSGRGTQLKIVSSGMPSCLQQKAYWARGDHYKQHRFSFGNESVNYITKLPSPTNNSGVTLQDGPLPGIN